MSHVQKKNYKPVFLLSLLKVSKHGAIDSDLALKHLSKNTINCHCAKEKKKWVSRA